MNAYLPRQNIYLHCILAGEEIPSTACKLCQQPARWHCLCCLGRPMFCQHCCRNQHEFLIFHQVQKWTGRFFQDASLWEVGVRLCIGHSGQRCPSQQILMGSCDDKENENDELDRLSMQNHSQAPNLDVMPALLGRTESPEPDDELTNDDPDDPTWEDVPPEREKVPLRTPTPLKDDLDIEHLLIVDSSGLISLPVIWCRCAADNHPEDNRMQDSFHHSPDVMLLDLELLPASYDNIKMVFTFRCLDDYRLSNLECKMTAYQYFQQLRRITNPAFPQSVPNRYIEFR